MMPRSKLRANAMEAPPTAGPPQGNLTAALKSFVTRGNALIGFASALCLAQLKRPGVP